jgi:EAL domain-containing protein (putative c-di-GMP-specific phosphodiesterase class I)
MIINAYGHDMSEQVVRDIMGRIEFVLAPKDKAIRCQRDQIMLCLANSYPEDSEQMARRITNIVQNYGRESYLSSALHVLANIASVHFPSEAKNPSDILDKAYTALHSSQDSIYRPYAIAKMQADHCRQQMGLASYLFTAYREQRLRMAWQPVVSTAKGNIAHYEALLRVRGNNGKISSAGALIPVAEKMGLIDTIDEMVMELVIGELRHSPNVSLAFNVSNNTTENQAWLDRLHALVDETPEIAPRLVVEITETAAQRDLRRVAYFVACIQSMGCQVALDDFGSGYTSFRQLKALSVDYVKIDGVFIRDIATNADSRFFVKTMLDFIKGFGLKSVAEFVETGEIAKILMDMGVDYLQGYYLGKPANTRTWLNEGEYKAD